MKNFVLPFLVSALWIGFSEFLRNEFLFKNYWIEHFSSLGLVFETLPINGVLWFAWSIGLAYLILRLLEKFSFQDTVFLAWISSFVMMWITAYNLQVLPLELLLFAVPLSIIEVVVAAMIIIKLKK